MIPAKVKDFIAESSVELGLPEEDLGNMVSFYFKELKKRMSKLDHLQFVIRGLGVMKMKGWELEKSIEKMESRMVLTTNPDNIKALSAQILIYQNAHKKWVDQVATKKNILRLKKEYYANKIMKNELEGKNTSSLGQ